MTAPVVLRRDSHCDPELHGADDYNHSCVEDTDKDLRPLSCVSIEHASDIPIKVYCSEPFSSSPCTSPRTSASPQTTNITEALAQDSDPVPFSSTPDLGSRTASSSPNTEYDSHCVVTPPEEKFIRTLDQKLQALVNAQNRPELSYSCVFLDDPHAQDGGKPIEDGSSPSPLSSTGSRSSSKRKRTRPLTCDNSVESVESTNDEDSDTDFDDRATRLKMPASKRLKETAFNYIATEAASARRARSLSATSSHESLVSTERASPSPPSTPVYKAPAVPIIAPPAFDLIPPPPFSSDDIAEARLKVLLQKEKVLRRREGFEKGINNMFDSSTTKEQVDELLGIDEDFRKEVIIWMLRITPSKKLGVKELRHELLTCPETRFHAILLFTRYFMRVGDAMPIATERETPLMRMGRKRIIWDVAMSCLALAIKFNRDFLCPLSPVYSREFLVLAPHPMSHDDFEISQKDVLQALDYEIRDITPSPFMQEIWNSLSSLRKLLSFPDGWEITQLNVWQILNAAATASEMLQFPMSLLSAAALIEGAVVALIDIYEQDVDDADTDRTAREEAEAVISDTVMDMRELMDIASADMKRCRRWLQKIIRATY